MPSDTARRGRPRGSGLDDRSQLRRIADMLEADPSLKPTTAIRAIGVSDPSAIRRLRDKLKAEQPRMVAARPSAHMASVIMEASAPRDPVLRSEPIQQPRAADRPAESGLALAVAETPRNAWFADWYAAGLSALAATVEAQMAVLEDFLQMPPVASALRHQMFINEVTKAFCPPFADVPSPTLH